jgi:molybdate transport system ATP-binding protein
VSAMSVTLRKQLPGFDLDVGWTVGSGFTVLFGYSGAGKSLTLSMIAGTMRPDGGSVRLAEETLVDTHTGGFVAPQQRRIGYVSQQGGLFPHMTVRRNIEYALGGTERRARCARVSELLERLRIGDLAEKRPWQISGGERQRAALARALAPRPRALLLDEPLSALDLPIRVEMREVLREVQRDSAIPVVMVTHDLYEAVALADTMVVYAGTGTVQVGAPRELVGSPATPEIQRLLHAMELPPGAFRREADAKREMPRERGEKVTLSARNQLKGRVVSVVRGPVNSTVKIELAGGDAVVASVTSDALDELRLAVGSDATAVFKASSVMLAVDA